jgi:hypothetical protein
VWVYILRQLGVGAVHTLHLTLDANVDPEPHQVARMAIHKRQHDCHDNGEIVGALSAKGEVAQVPPCTQPEHTAWGGLTYYSVDHSG